MTNYKLITTVLSIAYFLFACDSSKKQIAKVQTATKELNFGEITMSDSIVHNFYLKNVSNMPLKISEVGTSCGCTTTSYTRGEIGQNETASVEVLFIPEQIGIIDKSIVVETNTDPPFSVFYIKGEVK